MDRLWTLILAGGAGRRLAALTGGVPKQFWRPAGGPSLLDRTLTRLAPLALPDRTVVVLDEAHRRFAARWARSAGLAIYQAADRGTAAGLMRGLVEVLACEPEALVLVTPADHGVRGDEAYRHGLRRAEADVRRGTATAVLMGVKPTREADDYGWIVPARDAPGAGGCRPVAAFVEKPPAGLARRLRAAGGVWSTMVLVAAARTLHETFERHTPRLADLVRQAVALPPDRRARMLAAAYSDLPVLDLSRDVLEPARGLFVRVWSAAVGWSDLGTPARVAAWLSLPAGDGTVSLGVPAA